MKKNILLIIPSLGGGGAQRSLAKLSILLQKEYNVKICVFNKHIPTVFPYAGDLLSLEVNSGRNIIEKGFNLFRRIGRLKKIKKENKIDISISFLAGANYINVLSRLNDKTIVSVRGSYKNDKEISGFIGFLNIKILIPVLHNLADKVVVVSEGLKGEMINEFNINLKKIVVVYNSFDHFQISETITSSILPEKIQSILSHNKVLTTFGRLHQIKGYWELLDLHKQLVTDYNFKLFIIGDGPLRESLIEKARKIGLKTFSAWENIEVSGNFDIYFLGYIKDPYVYAANSSLFVFPSKSEGFPNALVEAMLSGIPVIATDCHSGPREILSDETIFNYNLQKAEYTEFGVLMPQLNINSIDTWKETIIELLNNKNLLNNYKVKGRERIINKYSASKIENEWLKVISN